MIRTTKKKRKQDIIDEWGDKDDEVITASQAATIEDITSKYEGVNVVSVENNTERFEVKSFDKD